MSAVLFCFVLFCFIFRASALPGLTYNTTGGRVSAYAGGGGAGEHQDRPRKVETQLRPGYDRLRP